MYIVKNKGVTVSKHYKLYNAYCKVITQIKNNELPEVVVIDTTTNTTVIQWKE